jgi:hypothetical protein
MNPVGLGLYIGMMALGGALLPRLRRGARRSAAIGLLALGVGFAASWWWTAPPAPPVGQGCAAVAIAPTYGAPT